MKEAVLMKKKTACFVIAFVFCSGLLLGSCGTVSEAQPESLAGETKSVKEQLQTESDTVPKETEETNMEKVLRLYINDVEVAVDWEDNESVSVLRELVSPEPLTVQMSMYGGFEQVGPLGKSLPRNDSQTTTAAGDIVLYSGNQIVIFYGSNSWAYTRLGHITDRDDAGMAALLGNGNVTITISMEG
jgi:hypothetical protein